MPEFQREHRYVVIKRARLSVLKERRLNAFLKKEGISTLYCVVVEHDWPEFEPVWKMIEDRMKS